MEVKKEANKTTLIIGAVCEEGIALIGDTKIVDQARNTSTHEDKILLPMNLPIAVGASGLTDLFRRFNREIPIIVERRQMEVRIKNEEVLRKIGKSITDFDVEQTVQSGKNLKKPPPPPKSDSKIRPPYVYTGTDFLNDCKHLISKISAEGKRYTPNPLEVLLSFAAGGPALFHINSDGFERQIKSYVAIGSGSVYVDMFFDRLWKQKTMLETISLASFVIKFVQDMKLDNFVGVDEGKLPQVVIILNDARWGPVDFENEPEFLADTKTKIEKISKDFEDVKITILKPPQQKQ